MSFNSKKHLIAIAIALAVSLPIPSFAESTDGIIATVNEEIILKSELEQAMAVLAQQYHSQNQNINNNILANQALDLLITRKLQLGIIKRAGVTPNDAIINRQLLTIAKEQGFDDLASFAADMDKKQAGSYAALRNELIEVAAMEALWQHQLSTRVKVSEQEIDAFLASPDGQALNQDEYRTIHIRVPYLDDPSRLSKEQKDAATQTANRLKQALQAGQSLQTAMNNARGNYALELQGADTGYNTANRLPRELAATITSLNVGEISEPIITDAGVDVVMLADKRTGGAVILPEWDTSHILVRVDSSQTPAIAEQKINEIYAALQQGQSFEDLAATYSDDAGSASQRGNLGWVGEDQMVPQFEQMMKNTDKGDYSTPFRTQFGYHILKVNNIRQRDVTEQYRRAQAEQILISRLAPQAQEDWISELKAAAYIDIKQ